jgi:hypothetical protein
MGKMRGVWEEKVREEKEVGKMREVEKVKKKKVGGVESGETWERGERQQNILRQEKHRILQETCPLFPIATCTHSCPSSSPSLHIVPLPLQSRRRWLDSSAGLLFWSP